MGKVIALKIDVSKIDKKRLFKGKNGIYLDAIFMFNDEPDQYGQNGMILQSITKEERAAGVKGEILGNGKLLAITGGKQKSEFPQDPANNWGSDPADDMPF